MNEQIKVIMPLPNSYIAELLSEYDVILAERSLIAREEEIVEEFEADLALLNQFLEKFGLQLPARLADIHYYHESFESDNVLVYQALKSLFEEPIKFGEDGFDLFNYFLSMQDCLVCIGCEGDDVFLIDFGADQSSLKRAIKTIKKMVEKEISRLRSQKSLQEPEPYQTSFDNLFHLYFDEGRSLLEELQNNQEQKYLPKNHFPELSPFFLFVASFEGFLNLIYELYLSKEYRDDDRVRDHLKRAPLDVKLRLAPAYCSCFRKKIIESNESFKKFQAVIELRNDFVHANLTEVMIKHKIEIDGIPFKKHLKKRRHHYDLPRSPYQINVKHLEFVCDVIEHTVELVLGAMKPRHKRELDLILHKPRFEARFIDDEYVVDIDETIN